jgi:hypothetical protein
MKIDEKDKRSGFIIFGIDLLVWLPNGLRYPRWGRDGEAVQPEK